MHLEQNRPQMCTRAHKAEEGSHAIEAQRCSIGRAMALSDVGSIKGYQSGMNPTIWGHLCTSVNKPTSPAKKPRPIFPLGKIWKMGEMGGNGGKGGEMGGNGGSWGVMGEMRPGASGPRHSGSNPECLSVTQLSVGVSTPTRHASWPAFGPLTSPPPPLQTHPSNPGHKLRVQHAYNRYRLVLVNLWS